MYICICHSVTDKAIRAAAAKGASSMEALAEELNVGTCCGRCSDCARKVLNQSLCENMQQCGRACAKSAPRVRQECGMR